MDLSKALLELFRSHWPPSGGSHGTDGSIEFDIMIDDRYKYPFDDDVQQPAGAFATARSCVEHIKASRSQSAETQQESQENTKPTVSGFTKIQQESVEELINTSFVELIFGSNAIEQVGCPYEETMSLCRSVLASEDVVVSSRATAEVIQHAQALKYIVEKVIFEHQPISEALIRKTHRILCSDIPLEDGSGDEYAGVYRTCSVVAGFTSFTDHQLVPLAMKSLVQELNQDILDAEIQGKLDPFMLAATYCHKFVNIHPFVDGNGRTCRLLLNVLLLKYAGIVICLGYGEGEREEYLRIAANGSMAEQVEDEERDFYWPAWAELATLVLMKGTARLEEVRELV